MCLILFSFKSHSQYPLIIAANRDEYFHRPTQELYWWAEHPEILAGRDLDGGGLWMGISRRGRFAAVTNVREGSAATGNYLSRGQLALQYLTTEMNDHQFHQFLQRSRDRFRGYNLLFGNSHQLQHFSNRGRSVNLLSPGIYGLSNASLDSPWPKVEKGKAAFFQLLKSAEIKPEDLLETLNDRSIAADADLPDTGIGLEAERQLSAICIQGDRYGTRSSSVLTVDDQGNVVFHEQKRAPEWGPPIKHTFRLMTD